MAEETKKNTFLFHEDPINLNKKKYDDMFNNSLPSAE